MFVIQVNMSWTYKQIVLLDTKVDHEIFFLKKKRLLRILEIYLALVQSYFTKMQSWWIHDNLIFESSIFKFIYTAWFYIY